MTEAQLQWLADHPDYGLVQHSWLHFWADQGYLWADGRFTLDDGKTLFWRPFSAGARRVGRRYYPT